MATKAHIVEYLASHLEGVTKKLAGEVVDTIFDHIAEHLAKGEKVQIPGFGTFVVSARKARQGRNPQTGETMHIPASKSVRFKVGKKLKHAVN